jgi:epoxyqueuosine reductase
VGAKIKLIQNDIVYDKFKLHFKNFYMSFTKEIKSYAQNLGFHIVKIIPAEPLKDREKKYYKNWLKKGFAGDMEYLYKNLEKRIDINKILPEAQSIICLAMNYYQKAPKIKTNAGKIARYAWGEDYHIVIKKKLKKLTNFILKNYNKFHWPAKKTENIKIKIFTDTAPILERAYAAKAGIGFIGKNTHLITKDYGSWVFLAELAINLKLEYDQPEKIPQNCGTCTRCIDACPTKAIVAPYQVDARKCIAYLTIENKTDKIPKELRKKMRDRIFGCDICQEVCPHNCRAKETDIAEFKKHIVGPSIDVKEIKSNPQKVKALINKSPLKRTGIKGLTRNIKHML